MSLSHRLRRIACIVGVGFATLPIGCSPPAPSAATRQSLPPETDAMRAERRSRLGWGEPADLSFPADWHSGEILAEALQRPVGDTVLIAWCVRSRPGIVCRKAIVGELQDSQVHLVDVVQITERGTAKPWRKSAVMDVPNFTATATSTLPLDAAAYEWFLNNCSWLLPVGGWDTSESGQLQPPARLEVP